MRRKAGVTWRWQSQRWGHPPREAAEGARQVPSSVRDSRVLLGSPGSAHMTGW